MAPLSPEELRRRIKALEAEIWDLRILIRKEWTTMSLQRSKGLANEVDVRANRMADYRRRLRKQTGE